MDVNPSAEQRQLVDAFAALYADASPPEAVRACEPLGHSPELWRRLLDMGAVEMALPESAGGGGATLLDLALVAEQHGRYVAPAPLVEAQVAARLLAALGEPAADVVGEIHDGRLVTLAVRRPRGDQAQLVPAGAVADAVIVARGEDLVLVETEGRASAVATLGCQPVADVSVAATDRVLASGPAALSAYQTATDEWRVLTAAALTGLAARALEIGVSYVLERKAFDRTLGSFQGVAHPLADRASEVDGSELLVHEAAWAQDEEPARFAELAAMALGFAAETARDTSYYALHFHGGYGFMLEYPIQLYYRRARSWAAVLESPQASFRRVADLRLAAV
ncbi:MAG TPA: acyl-CoA dehydrogenase family protein [Mycobacteriales bacterium]|nr:acyl-CoA dehydrogenase family protein [Mycobacteriales bacterium]